MLGCEWIRSQFARDPVAPVAFGIDELVPSGGVEPTFEKLGNRDGPIQGRMFRGALYDRVQADRVVDKPQHSPASKELMPLDKYEGDHRPLAKRDGIAPAEPDL